MRRFRASTRSRRALAALVGALFCVTTSATPAWSRDSILLMGNSFTAGIKSKLRSLIRSSGRDVSVRVRATSGYTLNQHVNSRTTMRRLRDQAWNHVVLQEQSDGIDVDRYPDARTLDAEAAAVGARTVFFMTWGDRSDPLYIYDDLRGVPGGEIGYVPIAFELDAAVAPIGWAFREVVLEEPGAGLWGDDGHHAGERGRYLAALVLYATIYGESPVGLWPSPRLAPEQVLHDQELAARVVLGDPAEWNLDLPAAP